MFLAESLTFLYLNFQEPRFRLFLFSFIYIGRFNICHVVISHRRMVSFPSSVSVIEKPAFRRVSSSAGSAASQMCHMHLTSIPFSQNPRSLSQGAISEHYQTICSNPSDSKNSCYFLICVSRFLFLLRILLPQLDREFRSAPFQNVSLNQSAKSPCCKYCIPLDSSRKAQCIQLFSSF